MGEEARHAAITNAAKFPINPRSSPAHSSQSQDSVQRAKSILGLSDGVQEHTSDAPKVSSGPQDTKTILRSIKSELEARLSELPKSLDRKPTQAETREGQTSQGDAGSHLNAKLKINPSWAATGGTEGQTAEAQQSATSAGQEPDSVSVM